MRPPRRVLALLAVLVLAGGVGTVATGGVSRDTTYTVTAYFPKTIGLFPESDVRVLGVAIGKVRGVTPQGPRVQVVMELERSRKVPADARAIIVPISLISDRYVQLEPPYESGPTLQDGDMIDIDRTVIPAELDDLLAGLKKFLDALEAGSAEDPGALGDAIANAAAALEGTGENLDRTLAGAGPVAEAIVSEAAALDGVIVHLAGLLDALAQRRTQLTSLNANLAEALGGIAAESAALEGSLNNIALLTEQLGGLLQDHSADLKVDLDILARTTQAALRHQDSLIRTNDWLHVLADAAEESHNGGAIHTVGGVTHIDVRDAHAGCPPAFGPLVCAVLFPPVPAATSSEEASSSRPLVPSPAPVPDDLLPDLPLLDPLDDLEVEIPPAAAAGVGLTGPLMDEEEPGLGDRVASWFRRMGGLLHRLVEAVR